MKISYSEGDRADTEEVLGNGATYRLIARDIRRERTGVHALIAIAVGGKILESDVFNLGRAEDRQRLAKKVHTAMGPSHREAKPLNHIIDDLLNFCLSILREWEEQRFSISEVVEGETVIEPMSFLLTPYLLRHGSTIMFAPPGAGKSYITQIMAVCVATGMSHIWEVQESPTLYVNLERSQQSLERREMAIRNALGLVRPRTGLRYLHARGSSLASIARKVRRLRQEEPELVVFLDSVSRAQSGSLNEDEPANRFIDTMNYAADSWFAIGHTPRADASHLFGSIHFEAGEDVGVKLTSERRGDSLGICLTITKANDIGFKEPEFLALEFEKDALVNIRHARRGEFPDLLLQEKTSLEDKAIMAILDSEHGNMTAEELARACSLNPDDARRLLRSEAFERGPVVLGRGITYGRASHREERF